MEYLEEFNILLGFKFLEAYETEATCKEDNTKDFATIIRFVNEKHVAIDMIMLDGELSLTEPYAVNENFKPIDK